MKLRGGSDLKAGDVEPSPRPSRACSDSRALVVRDDEFLFIMPCKKPDILFTRGCGYERVSERESEQKATESRKDAVHIGRKQEKSLE